MPRQYRPRFPLPSPECRPPDAFRLPGALERPEETPPCRISAPESSDDESGTCDGSHSASGTFGCTPPHCTSGAGQRHEDVDLEEVSVSVNPSGAQNVHWESSSLSWRVHYCELRSRRRPKRWIDSAARVDEALGQGGSSSSSAAPASKRPAPYASSLPGVSWLTNFSCWEAVFFCSNGKRLSRRFKPSDTTYVERDRARTRAEEQRRSWEQEHNKPEAQQAPPSDICDLTWLKWDRAWRLKVVIKDEAGQTKVVQKRFRPKDVSPEEVELARLQALACRDTLLQRGAASLPDVEGEDFVEELSEVDSAPDVVTSAKPPRKRSRVASSGGSSDCQGVVLRRRHATEVPSGDDSASGCASGSSSTSLGGVELSLRRKRRRRRGTGEDDQVVVRSLTGSVVPNITFSSDGGWRVNNLPSKHGKTTSKLFSMATYIAAGYSHEEADRAALQAAMAFRNATLKGAILDNALAAGKEVSARKADVRQHGGEWSLTGGGGDLSRSVWRGHSGLGDHRSHRGHREHREHREHRDRREHRERREHRDHRTHRDHRDHRSMGRFIDLVPDLEVVHKSGGPRRQEGMYNRAFVPQAFHPR